MTDEEWNVISAQQQEAEAYAKRMAEREKFELAAFIIHRFCGGKIEFTLDEFAEALQQIDLQRYGNNDGRVVYITRPANPPAEDCNGTNL